MRRDEPARLVVPPQAHGAAAERVEWREDDAIERNLGGRNDPSGRLTADLSVQGDPATDHRALSDSP